MILLGGESGNQSCGSKEKKLINIYFYRVVSENVDSLKNMLLLKKSTIFTQSLQNLVKIGHSCVL